MKASIEIKPNKAYKVEQKPKHIKKLKQLDKRQVFNLKCTICVWIRRYLNSDFKLFT